MPDRQRELQAMLQSLRLPTMAEVCAELALKAAKEGLSHEAFLYELARLESERQAQQRLERRLAQSGLPREKTFATFQLDRLPMPIRAQIERLRSGEFVKDATNVVAVGPPGVGKSHVLAAVAHDLVGHGYTVLWTSTAQLMQRLLAAKRDLRLPKELAKLHRYACLILDDSGYVQHDQDEMEVLFTLLSDRYEQRSICLSTNLVFSEWERIFKNPLTTVDVSSDVHLDKDSGFFGCQQKSSVARRTHEDHHRGGRLWMHKRSSGTIIHSWQLSQPPVLSSNDSCSKGSVPKRSMRMREPLKTY